MPSGKEEYAVGESAKRRCHRIFTKTAGAKASDRRAFRDLKRPNKHLLVIPKPHQPGKWRLIVDLSSPRGKSVNDGIDPLLCSLSYARLDDAVLRILKVGTGSLLEKLDIESAYRMIPVHPDDRGVLGMRWQGSVCLDAALPFGLRSAPKIFSAVADTLLWIMFRNGITWGIHYLDDYLFCGTPDSKECLRNLDVALYTCKVLGVPVAINKVEAPTTSLTFLGIEIDTVKGQLRLPADKLGRLKDMLASWVARRSCTKKGTAVTHWVFASCSSGGEAGAGLPPSPD